MPGINTAAAAIIFKLLALISNRSPDFKFVLDINSHKTDFKIATTLDKMFWQKHYFLTLQNLILKYVSPSALFFFIIVSIFFSHSLHKETKNNIVTRGIIFRFSPQYLSGIVWKLGKKTKKGVKYIS